MRKFILYIFLLFSAPLCEAQINATQSAILAKKIEVYIASIQEADPQSVAYGTAFGSLTLPSTRNATLSNGQVVSLSITWSSAGYDGNSPGLQTIFGDPTVPSYITNPFLVQTVANISVQEQIITETITAPTGGQSWVVPDGVDTITTAEGIGSGATGSSVGTINRAPGGGGGGFSLKNDIVVTSGNIIPLYVGTERLAPLPSGNDIDGLDGDPSYFGPAIPGGSTLLFGAGAPGGGTGADGNYYSDYTTGNLYGPKASGSWPGSPTAPYMLASGGNNGTGFAGGTGGTGGQTSVSIGDTEYNGGNAIAAPASRGGAGGGAAGPTGVGGNASSSGGTNSVGGTGATAGISGNGGNGGAGSPGVAGDYGGGVAGSRNTVAANTRGGAGKQGWIRLVYSGSTTPPADPGDAYVFFLEGQSNMISPGSGASSYPGPHDAQMWINTATGFEPLEYGVNNNANSGNSATNLGPELGLANALAGLADGDIYFSKKGQSGTSMFSNWNVTTNSTGRTATTQNVQTLDYLIGQGKDILKVFFIFRQGEADLNSANPYSTATYLYGTGVPSSGLGATGNVYIDKTNNLVYGAKSSYGVTNWGAGYTLYQATGSGAPAGGTSTLGACYWDSTNDLFYIKTGASTWTTASVQDAVVRANYQFNFYKLIKYKIDQIELLTDVDFTVTEFKYIDLIPDNTTDDPTHQTAIVAAKIWCMANFDAENSSYASKTVAFSTISCSSCTTVDGVHLSTASEDAYGALIEAIISIP
jgi:hypothetical protein